MLLGHNDADLLNAGGMHTAQEIVHQPDTLRAVHIVLAREQEALSRFVQPLIARPDLRVILTGAGTSAFIGECLVPYLSSRLPCRLEAVATTDIVAGPGHYLERDTPTLLVSFGRSGNSPESVAAVDLADQLVGECHHLAITCNADGALAKQMAGRQRSYALTLPDATHDRGFAMTSSFTGMMYAALAVLTGVETMASRVDPIADAVQHMITSTAAGMHALSTQDFDRVVYLGSNGFKGLAQEAALKLLELTDGETVATFDTPMGFRHGPKTIITARTLIIVFVSNDPYTRRYDLDLIAELRSDAKAARIIAISAQALDGPDVLHIRAMEAADDCDLLFPMITAPQMFAFYQSLAHGKTPDNPNAAGLVNRVVQGVRIHATSVA
jgi:tagatose-6-phosphate ketose/aldose isomerase